MLIARTDAVAVALEGLTGQAKQQIQLLHTLLEDLQRGTILQAKTLRAIEAGTHQLLAAQAEDDVALINQLHTLLATIERLEKALQQSTPSGVSVAGYVDNLQNITVTGGNVGEITNKKNIFVLPARPTTRIDLDAALARFREIPLNTIPDPAPLPHGSHMPFRRNPLFVGREDDIKALARALAGGATIAIGQVAAATGLGGIGKTNLATEFVHRYGQFFAGGVFWLSFADPAAIPVEVVACGPGLIDRPDWSALKADDQVRLVRECWEEPVPRLLVFDNCDDIEATSAEELLEEWLPKSGGAVVLVTSRRGTWDMGLGVTHCALGVLARVESIDLLQKLRPRILEILRPEHRGRRRHAAGRSRAGQRPDHRCPRA